MRSLTHRARPGDRFAAKSFRWFKRLRGEVLPIPDAACSDPHADLEEPIYLILSHHVTTIWKNYRDFDHFGIDGCNYYVYI